MTICYDPSRPRSDAPQSAYSKRALIGESYYRKGSCLEILILFKRYGCPSVPGKMVSHVTQRSLQIGLAVT